MVWFLLRSVRRQRDGLPDGLPFKFRESCCGLPAISSRSPAVLGGEVGDHITAASSCTRYRPSVLAPDQAVLLPRRLSL